MRDRAVIDVRCAPAQAFAHVAERYFETLPSWDRGVRDCGELSDGPNEPSPGMPSARSSSTSRVAGFPCSAGAARSRGAGHSSSTWKGVTLGSCAWSQLIR